jgi:hypothetical protein
MYNKYEKKRNKRGGDNRKRASFLEALDIRKSVNQQN